MLTISFTMSFSATHTSATANKLQMSVKNMVLYSIIKRSITGHIYIGTDTFKAGVVFTKANLDLSKAHELLDIILEL